MSILDANTEEEEEKECNMEWSALTQNITLQILIVICGSCTHTHLLTLTYIH